MTSSKIPLLRPNIHVRVRPFADEGGHCKNGERVYKELYDYGEKGVKLKDSHGITTYKFCKSCLGPDSKQEQVYENVASQCVSDFIKMNGYNILLFAYGQTGTGKTYTIFGPEPSWNSPGDHELSGIFPRAIAQIFFEMSSNQSNPNNDTFVLTASAMEFYMFDAFDLLDKCNSRIKLDPDTGLPVGASVIEIKNPKDCIPFMKTIRETRATASTRMNSSYVGHSGSSRSHATIILTLRRRDKISDRVRTTHLSVVDLAGAERPSSNNHERLGAYDALVGYYKGQLTKDQVAAAQGSIVNYELHSLRTTIKIATNLHRRRKPFTVPKQLATAFVKFASGCMGGSSKLSVIVTLSPAPASGWETWFSCTYGEDLAELRVPVVGQISLLLDKLITKYKKEFAALTDRIEKSSSTGPTARFYSMWQSRQGHLRNEINMLEKLRFL